MSATPLERYSRTDPSSISSCFLYQIVYFGRCIPWIIIDKMPMFRKYKLQPTKVPSNAQMWKCTKAVLLSHFTIELPQVSPRDRSR